MSLLCSSIHFLIDRAISSIYLYWILNTEYTNTCIRVIAKILIYILLQYIMSIYAVTLDSV